MILLTFFITSLASSSSYFFATRLEALAIKTMVIKRCCPSTTNSFKSLRFLLSPNCQTIEPTKCSLCEIDDSKTSDINLSSCSLPHAYSI